MHLEDQKKVVTIVPILCRTVDGIEVKELGAGGGHRDLVQTYELEVDGTTVLGYLIPFLRGRIDRSEDLAEILSLVQSTMQNGYGRIRFNPEYLPDKEETDQLPLPVKNEGKARR